MTDKNTNLEEELFENKKKEKNSELPPFIKKIMEFIKRIFKSKEKNEKNEKKNFFISLGLSFGLLSILIGLGFIIFTTQQKLNKQTDRLFSLQEYKINNLESIGIAQNNVDTLSIKEITEKFNTYKKQKESYEKYIKTLQAPYDNLLKFLYLPSLNIWKDNFTGKLDIDLIGQRYIKKNPYEDTSLHTQRNNFFKYVGKNKEFNTVDNITIGDIKIDEKSKSSKLFTIPLTIEFTSNSKRSFLLLINKLSIISNPKNISLINEFVYYLWEGIKEHKNKILIKLKQNNPLYKKWNNDKIIGYELYEWIKNDRETDLIDNSLLNELIPELMVCGKKNNAEMCYYRFREKYISLPGLAYTLGIENNIHKKRDLKKFFGNITMLMKVDDFSFDKQKREDSIFVNNNIKYKGNVKITLYGRDITNEEIGEISQELGKICLDKSLNIPNALEAINSKIQNLGKIEQRLDTDKTKKLRELEAILKKIKKESPNFTNHEKVIKYFEIYRMLKDADICKTI